jgi:hypothetical protein
LPANRVMEAGKEALREMIVDDPKAITRFAPMVATLCSRASCLRRFYDMTQQISSRLIV